MGWTLLFDFNEKIIWHMFTEQIKRHILKKLLQKGFDTTIDCIEWYGISGLSLKGFFARKTNNSQQSIYIKVLTIRISLWSSLIHLSIQGELKADNIRIDISAVSDTPLELSSFETAFRIRKKFQLLQMETGNILVSFLHKQDKSQNHFLLQVHETTWDNILNLLKGHWLCPFIANSQSNTHLSLKSYFHFSKGSFLPLSGAKIDWNNFYLNRKNTSEPFEKIDQNFLMNILDEKREVIRNGQYVPFEQIPHELIDWIIRSEDPRYWSHHGVCLYGLGIALRENIKSRKFIRGASTITMQVARNLFLTHHRNLMRKTEETIIALLLENYYEISKENILELYLNLIEFAPGIYGIKNGVQFYFNKEVSDLSLIEILTITYIIPRPRHFYEALLGKTEQLQRNLRAHIKTYILAATHKKNMETFPDTPPLDYCIRFAPLFGPLDLSEHA